MWCPLATVHTEYCIICTRFAGDASCSRQQRDRNTSLCTGNYYCDKCLYIVFNLSTDFIDKSLFILSYTVRKWNIRRFAATGLATAPTVLSNLFVNHVNLLNMAVINKEKQINCPRHPQRLRYGKRK